jgi:CRISPR-associated protein Cst2
MSQENNHLPNITATVIFDASALNRDEKIGGNILSVKKLNVNGDERSFISKPAIRHYLFETLNKAFGWEPARVRKKSGGNNSSDVVQFDLFEDDIFQKEELDAFGYMYTISGQNSLTRKSPVGITKALSLSSFNQDMAFYGNHDLVKRGEREGYSVSPNPYNKEEHSSFYKLSFTIDGKMLGEDEWPVKNYKVQENQIEIEIEDLDYHTLKNVKREEDEKGSRLYEIDGSKIYVDDINVYVQKELMKSDKNEVLKFNKGEGQNFQISPENYEEIEIDQKSFYLFSLHDEPHYRNKQTLVLQTGAVKEIPFKEETTEKGAKTRTFTTEKGQIEVQPTDKKGFYLLKFSLNQDEKERRLKELLKAVKNGLYAQSSGEANTITPLFMIAAPVKVPSPIFHSYLDISYNEGYTKIIGLQDALNNGWIDDDQSVFIQGSERLGYNIKEDKKAITDDWSTFEKRIGSNNNG